MKLAMQVLKKDVLSLSRLISMIEREDNGVDKLMKYIHPHTGKAHCIGVTGPPGVGKSTLVDKLTAHMRKDGLKIGIIAVDPSSPFSGGAVLGDRVRMHQHYTDSNVYIRSMGSRGCMGGLPQNPRGRFAGAHRHHHVDRHRREPERAHVAALRRRLVHRQTLCLPGTR